MTAVEFSAYARIVLQRWRLIIALILLATVTAYVTNAQGPVAYRATASLSVTPSIVEYWTGQAVERLLNNYALQIRSRPFASIVAKAAGLPEDALTGRIRAVAAPAEFRLSLEVDDADPELASTIVNLAANAFVAKIRAEISGRERQDIRLEVLEPALRPDSPVSPRPGRAGLGGAIAGALLGAGLAVVLTFWDGRIYTAGDAERSWNAPVLGAIPSGPPMIGRASSVARKDGRAFSRAAPIRPAGTPPLAGTRGSR